MSEQDDMARYCGEEFAKLLRLEFQRDGCRDLLLQVIAERYERIKSPRSRLAHVARAYLRSRYGSAYDHAGGK